MKINNNTKAVLCAMFSPIFVYEYDVNNLFHFMDKRIPMLSANTNNETIQSALMRGVLQGLFPDRMSDVDDSIVDTVANKLLEIIHNAKTSSAEKLIALKDYAAEIMVERYTVFTSYDEMDSICKMSGLVGGRHISFDLTEPNEGE